MLHVVGPCAMQVWAFWTESALEPLHLYSETTKQISRSLPQKQRGLLFDSRGVYATYALPMLSFPFRFSFFILSSQSSWLVQGK